MVPCESWSTQRHQNAEVAKAERPVFWLKKKKDFAALRVSATLRWIRPMFQHRRRPVG